MKKVNVRRQLRAAAGTTRAATWVACVVGLTLAVAMPCAGATPTITMFDIPGGPFLALPQSINACGVVTGAYTDLRAYHGFLRAANGTITTFDIPFVYSTFPVSINLSGEVAGYVQLFQDEPNSVGFLMARNGTITTFSVPGSSSTRVAGLNALGAVTGTATALFVQVGFLRDPFGNLTIFQAGSNTIPTAINTGGAITGYTQPLGSAPLSGFVRAPDGTITTFDAPNAGSCITGTSFQSCGMTLPMSINFGGTITGFYLLPSDNFVHGFVRTADGTITSFDFPEASPLSIPTGFFIPRVGLQLPGTFPTSIGDGSTITGLYSGPDIQLHGFLRAADGTFTSFDAGPGTPSVVGTAPLSMSGGWITGQFVDTVVTFEVPNLGASHGFVRNSFPSLTGIEAFVCRLLQNSP